MGGYIAALMILFMAVAINEIMERRKTMNTCIFSENGKCNCSESEAFGKGCDGDWDGCGTPCPQHKELKDG